MIQKLKFSICILVSTAMILPAHGRTNISSTSDEMERLIVRAQNAYFNAPINEAIEAFKKVTSQSRHSHWEESIRESIIYSYGRLAQLDAMNETKWFDELYKYDSDAMLPSDIFSPKTIESFEKGKMSFSEESVAWTGNNLPEAIDSLKLNGEEFSILSLNKRIHKKGLYLLTLNSSQLTSETFRLSGTELVAKTDWGLKKTKPTLNLPKKKLSQKEDSPVEPVKLVANLPESIVEPSTDLFSNTTSDTIAAKPNRTWLWIALGTIATGVTIYLIDQNSKSKNEDEKKKKPTHTEAGFGVYF